MVKTLKDYCILIGKDGKHRHENSCMIDLEDVKEWLTQKRDEKISQNHPDLTLCDKQVMVNEIDELLAELEK